MTTPESNTDRSTAALLASGFGFFATLVTGVACVGPLLAIVLGVGGFGWLTRYAELRVPASVATALLVAVGLGLAYRKGCPRSPARRRARALAWAAALLALGVNAFEYLVFPHL